MNILTIRKLQILNLIQIIIFKTFKVYLFTILHLRNEQFNYYKTLNT